eukprot:jgi/Ulvmu1/10304/UM060_0106.1
MRPYNAGQGFRHACGSTCRARGWCVRTRPRQAAPASPTADRCYYRLASTANARSDQVSGSSRSLDPDTLADAAVSAFSRANSTQGISPHDGARANKPENLSGAVPTISPTASRDIRLASQTCLADAVAALQLALTEVEHHSSSRGPSGAVRLHLQVPASFTALQWLLTQSASERVGRRSQPAQPSPVSSNGSAGRQASQLAAAQAKTYFSPRQAPYPAHDLIHSPTVAGLGAAWLWRGEGDEELGEEVLAAVHRFVQPFGRSMRAMGGARFDSAMAAAPEWQEFGRYCLLIPAIELVEGSSMHEMSVNVVWDAGCSSGHGARTCAEATQHAQQLLARVAAPAALDSSTRPLADTVSTECLPSEGDWEELLGRCLAELEDVPRAAAEGTEGTAGSAGGIPRSAIEQFLDGPGLSTDLDSLLALSGPQPDAAAAAASRKLSKVVLARRVAVRLRGALDALALLSLLQRADPSSYQVALVLPGGAAFVSSTPERLFMRHGRTATAEAIAGTRRRGRPGDVQEDFYLGLELMQGAKEHVEFAIVRDWVHAAMASVCSSVSLDVSKTLLKLRAVQHVYGRVSGHLPRSCSDADMLRALHPTPAVCGCPQHAAHAFIRAHEPFDRGFYCGPFGFLTGDSAEFVVGIRSALVRPASDAPGEHDALLYSGVGIVPGSDAASEWRELDLKVSLFKRALRRPLLAAAAPNAPAAHAALIVDELVRCGVLRFAVAPGSRSSPLVHAAYSHPHATLHVCFDERSLGFWAVGAATAAAAPVAIVTTSGTAVANLLPAAVEAAASAVPLVLLTADRPAELRACGANQTIDQVKLFGGYVRHAVDLPPPDASPAYSASSVLTVIDAAVRHAVNPSAPGPVHVNCQLRDPLAPVVTAQGVPVDTMAPLASWANTTAPFTTHLHFSPSALVAAAGAAAAVAALPPLLDGVVQQLSTAQRGLVLCGELRTLEDRQAARDIAQTLGWPIAADVLSGLRVGAPVATDGPVVLHHLDTILTDAHMHEAAAPDCVLQIGVHVVSKRIMQLLADRAHSHSMPWFHVTPSPDRHDERHTVAALLQCTPAQLRAAVPPVATPSPPRSAYATRLAALDAAVSDVLRSRLLSPAGTADASAEVTEPAVAAVIAAHLPPGHGLFAGNSMPIRDLDMFTTPRARSPLTPPDNSGRPADPNPVAANRGASGIDGVLSSAAGFAAGLRGPATLVVGDLSFVHDTNGLMLVRAQPPGAPLTVVLVNNGGGGIFSFLPIADAVPEEEFSELWETPPDVDLKGLCRAHRVAYQHVAALPDLLPALRSAWALNVSSVVEVTTNRADNVPQHRALQARCAAAARNMLRWDAALRAPPPAAAAPQLAATVPARPDQCAMYVTIHSLHFRRFALPYARPVTTGDDIGVRHGHTLMLTVQLPSGELLQGLGEASPLPGLHVEEGEDAGAQLAALAVLLPGLIVPVSVSALEGQLEIWWAGVVGLAPESLWPSVRFGVEAALFSALGRALGDRTLTEHLWLGALRGPAALEEEGGRGMRGALGEAGGVAVNALLDPRGMTAQQAAQRAGELADEGYSAIKVKVARSGDPAADAELVASVCEACGSRCAVRADANRLWTLQEAVQFAQGLAARGASLEYVEEPVRDPHDIARFYDRVGIPVALDESLDDGSFLPQILHAPAGDMGALGEPAEGVVAAAAVSAVVLKPAVLGSMERICALVRWCAVHGVRCVLSSAFEGPVGIAKLAAVAAAADALCAEHAAAQHAGGPSAHGLATLPWFAAEGGEGGGSVAAEWLQVRQTVPASASGQGAARAGLRLTDAGAVEGRMLELYAEELAGAPLQAPPFQATLHVVQEPGGPEAAVRMLRLERQDGVAAPRRGLLLFLHGFIGCAEDWRPVMVAMAQHGYECAAIDLPGHGASTWGDACVDPASGAQCSMPAMAAVVRAALRTLRTPCAADTTPAAAATIVGYSLGARVALQLAAEPCADVARVVSVSGSPGIQQPHHAEARRLQDLHTAELMREMELPEFVELWYQAPLWASLRQHPRFDAVSARRRGAGDLRALGNVLEGCTPGQQNLWGRLSQRRMACDVAFVVGEWDAKFVQVAQGVAGLPEDWEAGSGGARRAGGVHAWPSDLNYPVVEVMRAGHAVHEEQPLALANALRQLLG